MTTDKVHRRVVQLIVCAAPPATRIHELVSLLTSDAEVHVITTPEAYTWIHVDQVTSASGHPVRCTARRPNEPAPTVAPDVIIIAPLTFNTVNKWATGINDTLALGTLNEALSTGARIIAAPYTKSALAAHPAYGLHLAILGAAGVQFTGAEALKPSTPGEPFRWQAVLELLRQEK